MAVTVTWTITENRFPNIIRGMENKARAIVAKTALDLAAHAQSRAPVDTGNLKSSIQARQVGGNAESGSIHWRVTVGAEYGMYVEWGTVNMAAQPFMQPAIQVVTPAFLKAMRKVVSR